LISRLTTLALASLTLLASCGSNESSTLPNAPLAPSVTVVIDDSMTLSPLESFATGGLRPGAQYIELQKAIATCMTSKGWRYVVPSLPPEAPFDIAGLKAFTASNGYAATVAATDAKAASSNDEFRVTLSGAQLDQYYIDLTGKVGPVADLDTSDGGCAGSAAVLLASQVPLRNAAFVSAYTEVVDRLSKNVDVQAAWSRWRACMSVDGFEVRGAGEAIKFAQDNPKSAMSVAASDVRCRIAAVAPATRPLEFEAVHELLQQFPEFGPIGLRLEQTG